MKYNLKIEKSKEELDLEEKSEKFEIESLCQLPKSILNEEIYKYIYAAPKGELKKLFVYQLRKRKKAQVCQSYSQKQQSQSIGSTTTIQTLEEIRNRSIPGDWVGDLIIGKNNKSALGTLVERQTRLIILVPIKGKNLKTVKESFTNVFEETGAKIRLATNDEALLEVAEHKPLSEECGIKVYFSDFNSPWQKGMNEGINELLRQYFPRGTDFTKVTSEQIRLAQHRLNGRPRKPLQWETPYEAFTEVLMSSCIKLNLSSLYTN
jgi:IS30 family transposase